MTILLILYTSLLLAISLHCSKYDIFSPAVITAAIWVVCPVAYLILDHNLPPLGGQVLSGLALWSTGMCSSSLIISNTICKGKTYAPISNKQGSKPMRDAMLLYSVLTFPLLLIWMYNAITYGDSASWTTNLRRAAIGANSISGENYAPVYIHVWLISYTIELIHYDKKHKLRVIIPCLLYIIAGFALQGKTLFFTIFLITITILWFKKSIRLKHLIISFVILLMFFIWFQSIREGTNMDSDDKNSFIVLYLIGHMPAFDTVEASTSTHFGENVFRILYVLAYKLGISNIEPINPILPFINKPLVTNTYTVLYPFYVDFGYAGIIFFSIVCGSIYGYIYAKAKMGSKYAIVVYAYCVYCIVSQYGGEAFFYFFAGFLKFVLIAAIPFVFTMKKQSHTTTKELLSSNKYPMPNTN